MSYAARERILLAMEFVSSTFLIFCIIVIGLYYILPHKAQNMMLLAASYFFYGWWDWRFLFLIFISSFIDYFCSLRIERASSKETRKKWLIVSIGVNVCILLFFKYANFFIEESNRIISFFNLNVESIALRVIVPLGISFFTFQTMSYTIDVYRRIVKPHTSFWEYALYVSYFPQLVAGPIERTEHLMPQFLKKRVITKECIGDGLLLVYWGLFKKVFVADNCLRIGQQLFMQQEDLGGAAVLVGMYAYALYMYGDVSGYTDIARGVASFMGIRLARNFSYPYFALTIADFWKRWHMTVTSWFRDYVYFPLVVKLRGKVYRSAFITFLCIALWHRMSWLAVARGIYFGSIIVLYYVWKNKVSWRWKKETNRWYGYVYKAICIGVTFHLVSFGWLFFARGTWGEFLTSLRILCGGIDVGLYIQYLGWLCVFCGGMFVGELIQVRSKDEMVIRKQNIMVQLVIYWMLFWAIYGAHNGGYTVSFAYWRM